MDKKTHEHAATVKTAEPWWKNKRAKTAGSIIGAVFLLALIYWFFNLMPYVSTEDARIDADVVKAANLGASGQLIKVYVKEGDYVKEGQVIAELDHATAQAQLEKAMAKAGMSGTELKRASAVAAQQGISKQQLDRVRTDSVAAAADLKLAEIALERTYLKSPVDGIVIQKTAEAGNILESNQTAVIITDIEHAWISANVQEKAVGAVKPGQAVSVTIDEGGRLKGKVTEVRKAAASVFALIPSENASGNFVKVEQRIPIKVELEPHPGRELRVGQSVVIKIKVR